MRIESDGYRKPTSPPTYKDSNQLRQAMQTIRLELPESLARKLAVRAKERGLSSEAFVRMVTEEVLSRENDDFAAAVDHVLSKNRELYQRLAT